MKGKSPGRRPGGRAPAGDGEVEAFLAALDHPRVAEIRALRKIILDADPKIAEGIKWNAPSFRTSEYFATFHLRAPDGVQLILHLGAKKRDGASPRAEIADPDSLLEWLGPDRASVRFRDGKEIALRRAPFRKVLREWIAHVRP